MTLDRIKSMVDTKIKVDFAKFSNEEIIAELSSRVIKYKDMLEKINPAKEAVKHKYMSAWVESAQERIFDIYEVKKLESKLKISRIKILELIDLKKQING